MRAGLLGNRTVHKLKHAVNMDGNRDSTLAGRHSGHCVSKEPVSSMEANESAPIWEGKSTLQYLDHIIRKTYPRKDTQAARSGVRHSHSKKMEMKELLLVMLRQSEEMLRLSRKLQGQSEVFLAPEFLERSVDHLGEHGVR